jgi:hypothetical protein
MANEPGGGAGKELPQHPLVESLRPDPSQPAKKTVVLIGLPGKSDRPGYQRLYLTTKLNYYAEFLVSGILSSETIPADKSPFPGHEATQVTIGRDANIQYVTATSPQPVDEFDLDVRLGAHVAATAPVNSGFTCVPGDVCTDNCPSQPSTACGHTCIGDTCCGTCVATQCVAGPNDLQNPCVYTNNQGNTCAPQTQCQQATCVTCPAIATCPQTCGG